MMMPLGLAASASSEPAMHLLLDGRHLLHLLGHDAGRVTPCWRPAKVSTAAPASTGAARTPGRASMEASRCGQPRMPRVSRCGLTLRTSTARVGPAQLGRLRAAVAHSS